MDWASRYQDQQNIRTGSQRISSRIALAPEGTTASAEKSKAEVLPRSRTIFNAVFGQNPINVNSTNHVEAFPANIKRTYLIIQNKSTASIFIGFDQLATALTGLEIVAGGVYEPNITPVNTINVIGAQVGGSQIVICIQGLS